MSRGLGKMQRLLWKMVYDHGKPMTFEEMREVILQALGDRAPDRLVNLYRGELRPSFERSLRRALHKMVKDRGMMITCGIGGSADRFRYFIHPMVIAMMDAPKSDALLTALEADPGATAAQVKAFMETFPNDPSRGLSPPPPQA